LLLLGASGEYGQQEYYRGAGPRSEGGHFDHSFYFLFAFSIAAWMTTGAGGLGGFCGSSSRGKAADPEPTPDKVFASR
jgi:hypothetical protein